MTVRRRRVRRARLDVSGTAKPRTVLIGHFPEGAINWPSRAIRYELREDVKKLPHKIGKRRKRKTSHRRAR